MSGLRDLLRFCYRSVEGTLLKPGVPDQTPAISNADANIPDSAVDDEEVQDKEDQKAFLIFEVRVASRSGGIHDFEGQVAATSGVVKDLVTEQLSFFNDQLARARRSKLSLPSNQYDSTQRDPSQYEYEAVRDYANYVAENGQLDDKLEEALALSVQSECPALAAKVTRLNVSLEQLYEKEDIAAEKTDSKPAAGRNQTQMDHRELLYELLHNRTDCADEEHLAILPLSRLDDNDLHMFLSVCPQAGEKASSCQWHETRFLFCRDRSRDKGVNKPADLLNLCQRVRHYSGYRRRLFLHFDSSTLREKPEIRQGHDSRLQKPNPVNFGTILQGNGLREETGEIRMKKSLLALQLANALHLLYPGPWIQQNWDASSVLILGDERDDNADHHDLNSVYVRCKLVRDWKTTNPTWQEVDDPLQDTPSFLLAFAQLLVDISEGQVGARPEGSTERWRDALFDKADKLLGDKCLSYYGAAIQGCLQYGIDNELERERNKDSKQRARSVIQKNIVKNLQRNYGFWKRQWDDQLPSLGHHGSGNAAEAGRITRLPSTAAEQTCILQNAATPWPNEHTRSFLAPDRAKAPPHSFYTLFADEDEKAEERKPGDDYKSEFLTRMHNFYRQYILPLPQQAKPIRIAVLDTGLRVDDGDTLLRSGSKRVLAHSGNFLGAEYAAGGYLDNHGHGTHVVRLLLGLAPRAQIVVVKVSEGRSLASTRLEQIVKAVEWAGFEAEADIISVSFGLDEAAKDKMQPVIERIVASGKLIFAAASNSGGNGKRAYPARERGVFAIHATNDDGSSPTDLNPPRDEFMSNFATLGCRIPSRWDGRDIFITGTSFATPVAVAIAANALEFVQQAQDKFRGNPRHFFVYKGMHRLLSCMSNRKGDYDYVRPWKDDMFDDERHDDEDMLKKLQEMSIYH